MLFQLKSDEGHIERFAFDVFMSWYKSSQVQCSLFRIGPIRHCTDYWDRKGSKLEQDGVGGLMGECVVYPGDQIEIIIVAQFVDVTLSPNC